jgi:hypothetical protein
VSQEKDKKPETLIISYLRGNQNDKEAFLKAYETYNKSIQTSIKVSS